MSFEWKFGLKKLKGNTGRYVIGEFACLHSIH